MMATLSAVTGLRTRLTLLLTLSGALWWAAQTKVPWDVQGQISQRCLPPLALEAAIEICLVDYAIAPPSNMRDTPSIPWRERALFTCMARIGGRTSSRVWGVPRPACVAQTARILGEEDPYASFPPCPEEECGMKAQVRETIKWTERLCRALYPEAPPPTCG